MGKVSIIMTKNCEKSQVTRKIVRHAIFRNFCNLLYWLSKTRQPCVFYDFLQTREKSQFLQLRANLDKSAIFLVYAYKIFTIFNTHDDNACDNLVLNYYKHNQL